MTTRLEVTEPECTDVLAGHFTYTDPDGTAVSADFFVKCLPADPGNTEVMDARVDAVNTQLTDQWSELQAQGKRFIKYTDEAPSPFFM